MRSLFLKIFLWFWLATALVVTAYIVTTEVTRSRRQPNLGWLTVYGETAARILEREGEGELIAYFRRAEQRSNITSRLVDDGGRELTGRGTDDLPAAVKQSIDKVKAERAIAMQPINSQFYVTQRVEAPSGRPFTFVAQLPPPVYEQPVDPYLSIILRIFAVVLPAGLLCYWLARYIAAPVAKFRDATHQLAAGNLKVRVTPRLGRRRDELADVGRDFDLMAERIESLMNAQWRLLGDISHELRSPLARLNIALGLVRKKAGAVASVAIERIEQETGQMNEMIGQLLELDRWQFGESELPRETIDLAELIESVASDADYEAASRGCSVRVVKSQKCFISGVPQLLRSAIENVVRNAVRHTAEGTSVEISLDCAPARESGRAVVTIRDAGAGVPEEAIDDIFKPFYRVDEARDRESGGAGLGLAITERSVKLHRGAIVAANSPESGFVVQITLPVVGVEAPARLG